MRQGLTLAVFAALISGISVFLNGAAVKLADPLAYTLAKNLGALGVLAALALAAGGISDFLRLSRRQWAMLALIGVVGGSIPFFLFFWGLSLGGAAVSSFIFRSLFVFAGVFGWLLLKERPEGRDVIAGCAIMAGNALLLPGDLAFGFGQALVLAATALWALEYAISRKILAEVPARVVMVSRLLFGSLLLICMLGASGAPGALEIAPEALEWLILTSLMLALFMHAWYRALRTVPLFKAAAVLAMGGVVTAALNAIFMGTAPTPFEGFGLMLVLAGAAIAARLTDAASGFARGFAGAGA